jgi:hypothetical protein
VVEVAGTRLGMHIPTSTEIVFLPAARSAGGLAR